MFSLTSLISRSKPSDPRSRLLTLFKGAKDADEFTIPDLQGQLRQTKEDVLLPILAELTRDHVVDQIFRVISPKRGGIDDFESLEEVPDRIYDWRQDQEIDVEPRMVRLIFRKHREQEGVDLAAAAEHRGQ